MQINDTLMQMMLQNVCQTQNVSATGRVNDTSSLKTSFQDLLDHRRNGTVSASDQAADSQKTDVSDDETLAKPQDDMDAATDAQMLILAQTLSVDPFVAMQTVPTEQSIVQDLASSQIAAVQTVDAVGIAVLDGPTQENPVSSTEDVQMPVQTEPVAASGGMEQSVQVPADSENSAGGDMANADSRQHELETQTNQPPVAESWHTPLFQNTQNIPVRVGDAAVDMTAPADEVRGALTQTIKQAVEQGEEYVRIRLTPENLGTVVAEFTRSSDGTLHVVLQAENEQTVRMLSDHASALGMMLQDGIRGEVRVEVPHTPQEQTPWQNPDQGGGQQQQQQQQQHTPHQETESFLQQLRLGLVFKETETV